MADYEDGGAYLTMVLCISWIGDASAYYVGSRFGYHKNITEISPNKTWEGVVSEVIFAVGLAYLFKARFLISNCHFFRIFGETFHSGFSY